MTALADTALFIERDHDRPLLADPPEDVAVSVVTVGELRLAVLMAEDLEARERRLATFQLVHSLEPIPIDDDVAQAWAALVAQLRASGRSLPLNDSWIAATALARGLDVVTQRDIYDDVPGLGVIKL